MRQWQQLWVRVSGAPPALAAPWRQLGAVPGGCSEALNSWQTLHWSPPMPTWLRQAEQPSSLPGVLRGSACCWRAPLAAPRQRECRRCRCRCRPPLSAAAQPGCSSTASFPACTPCNERWADGYGCARKTKRCSPAGCAQECTPDICSAWPPPGRRRKQGLRDGAQTGGDRQFALQAYWP